MVVCPECESNLDLEEEDIEEGEMVSCPECGTDLEVISTNPLDLRPVTEEEDEEYDEEEEDEG